MNHAELCSCLGQLMGGLGVPGNREWLVQTIAEGGLHPSYVRGLRDTLSRVLMDAGSEGRPGEDEAAQAAGTIESLLMHDPVIAHETGAYDALRVLRQGAPPLRHLTPAQLDQIIFQHTPSPGEHWDHAAMIEAALALASPGVRAACAECGKTSTRDAMWALYCLPCVREKIAPALQPSPARIVAMEALLGALKNARPLLLYGDEWIQSIESVLGMDAELAQADAATDASSDEPGAEPSDAPAGPQGHTDSRTDRDIDEIEHAFGKLHDLLEAMPSGPTKAAVLNPTLQALRTLRAAVQAPLNITEGQMQAIIDAHAAALPGPPDLREVGKAVLEQAQRMPSREQRFHVRLEPTPEMYAAPIDGVSVPMRIWGGFTSSGIGIEAYVLSITPNENAEAERLKAELPHFMVPSRTLYAIDTTKP